MSRKIIALLIFFFPMALKAQEGMLTGNVFDNNNRATALEGATVRNLATKRLSITDKDGHYALPAKKGDLISVSQVGYKTDTIYLINLLVKNIYLTQEVNTLKAVDITQAKIAPELSNLGNPDGKGPVRQMDMDKSRGGLRLNLGYGKYRKNQAKIDALEEEERYNEEISLNFTETYVKNLTKFEGTKQELKDFVALYRPTVAEVKAQRPFNYEYHAARAYSEWKSLPPSKRKLPPLPKIKTDP